jgi:sterol desaturase/sphingolipid hydroxylase (fatty acid hydroxylase superfamily)
MQHVLDNIAIALGIVAALGFVSAIFYTAYHCVMIPVCYYRDTPPDQRAHTRPTYRTLSNTAKVHVRKGVLGLLASLGFFLLLVLVASPN